MSRHGRADNLMNPPIPTYEEALRPSSSQTLGPRHISHDAQRQGYRPPTVESTRNSLDSDLSIPEMVDDTGGIEELDYIEPGDNTTRQRIRSKFVSNLSATLGALRLSLRRRYTAVAPDTEERPPTWRARLSRSLHIPEQYRMSIPTFARLCALFTIAAFIWLLFSMNIFPRRHNMMATMFEPESVRVYLEENIGEAAIQSYLEHISSYAHEAGTEGSYFMAHWMLDTWRDICELDDIAIMSYNIMAQYPKLGGRSVKSGEWRADLEESNLSQREQTLSWHAYSFDGSATGPLIYANSGSEDDFQFLGKHISMNGSIALIHNHGQHAGMKIHFAQEAGCIGVLMFNGDQLVTPDEPGMPGNDSIHRANVALPNFILGEPMPASNGHKTSSALPRIPSLPLSWKDGHTLLSKLDKDGVQVPDHWLATGMHTGNGSTIVEMQNENDNVDKQKIFNVHATIAGADEPNMRVIVGAPRDSWCFGASHSASASAILTAVIEGFGALRKLGWRPMRTIEFVSWDASTFNFAGSTEYVEDTKQAIHDGVVAYVNVAAGISGRNLQAAGSPMLHRVLQHALGRINLPGGNGTLLESISENDQVFPLQQRSATDCSPFTYIAGVPSLDMQFQDERGHWVEGSCYDSFGWVQNFGDQGLEYHKVLANVWSQVVLDLASAPLLPLDARIYTDQIVADIDTFEKDASNLVATQGKTLSELGIDFTSLHEAAEKTRNAAVSFHVYEADWSNSFANEGGMEDLYQHRLRLVWNARLSQFEKSMIDTQQHKDDGSEGGLEGRPQYRHLLYAPQRYSDDIQTLPTVWELLEAQQWQKADNEIARIAAIIEQAGIALVGN